MRCLRVLLPGTMPGAVRRGQPTSEDLDDDEDRFDFEDATALLRAYSFLTTDEYLETPLYSTHRLVQLATRWWITKQGPEAEDRYALAALRSIASAFPSSKEVDHPTYLSRCEGLLPHAEPLLSHKYRNATPLPQATSPVPPPPAPMPRAASGCQRAPAEAPAAAPRTDALEASTFVG